MMSDNDKRVRVLAIIAAGLVLVGGLTIWLGMTMQPSSSADPAATRVGISWQGDTNSDLGEHTGYVTIPGFNNMTFISGQTRQSIELYNPESNVVTMTMTLQLADETVLWSQDGIKPGERVYEINLSSIMEPGKYDALIIFDCFKEDGTQVNGGVVQFVLTVI